MNLLSAIWPFRKHRQDTKTNVKAPWYTRMKGNFVTIKYLHFDKQTPSEIVVMLEVIEMCVGALAYGEGHLKV